MNTENKVVKEFRQIRQEYAFNPDIMCQDDPKVSRLKEIIDTKLSQVDKTIILLYADCLSYRKLGHKMNLSHMTIRREVIRIKNIILNEYHKTMKKAFEFEYYSRDNTGRDIRHEITIHADTREDAERIFKTNFGSTPYNCKER